jgi:hypothetical protein
MKIEFVFFHRELRGLRHPAAGEVGLVILKKGITGQLPHVYFPPGAAVFTAGLIPATRDPKLSHGTSLAFFTIFLTLLGKVAFAVGGSTPFPHPQGNIVQAVSAVKGRRKYASR